MKKFIKSVALCAAILMALSLIACKSEPENTETTTEAGGTADTTAPVEYNKEQFCSNIWPFDAPDPFITYDSETGYYYCLFTQGNRVEIYRSKHVADILLDDDSKIIYEATGANVVWGDIWAPEMHRAPDGFWYIYTSSRITKEPGEKRIFVLKSLTSDPFGEWEFAGRPAYDIFSIDPTIYTAPDGKQYMCYSRVDAKKGQVLDICEMTNPTICKRAKTIAYAELDWELVEPYVGTRAILEGPFFLENNGRLFIIYSANGCWSNHYALGVLELTGDDILDPKSWTKHPEPLLVYGNGVYGPGHASFFRSPDGTEVWCCYHGMTSSNDTVTYAERHMFIQKVEFDETGFPVMGKPIGYDALIDPPSGEIK